MRASQNAVDALEEAVARRLEINRTDLRCLDVLERHGGMNAGQLAEATGLTTGAITGVLDHLEAAGYARRVRDRGDRRRVRVEPTDLARQRAAELYGPMADAVRPHFERYGVGELVLLRDFLRLNRELNEEHARRLRAQTRPT